MPYFGSDSSASRRRYIVTAYVAGPDGVNRPVLPDSCPYSQRGGAACRLYVHHIRERKTGPGYSLTVMRCAEHGHAFTLYPRGHVPWGRLAVVVADRDGELVKKGEAAAPGVLANRDDPGGRTGLQGDGELNWAGTFFEAAAAAAAGSAWGRSGSPEVHSCWSSQNSMIKLSLDVLGLSSWPSNDLRRDIGEVLGIETLVLLEWAKRIEREPGYRTSGKAVVEVLRVAASRPGLLKRLLRAGYLVGCWGEPLWWDVDRKVMRHLAFPCSGTDPPPG